MLSGFEDTHGYQRLVGLFAHTSTYGPWVDSVPHFPKIGRLTALFWVTSVGSFLFDVVVWDLFLISDDSASPYSDDLKTVSHVLLLKVDTGYP